MPIAYSQATVIYTTGLRNDTSAHLRADLDTAFLAAGWVHTTNTVSNGWLYQCTSPQGLKANLLVQDTNTAGTGNSILFQMQGTGATNTGWSHTLVCSNAGTAYSPGYQIVVGTCQFFISLPNVSYFNSSDGGHSANAVAGGIPFLPASTNTECTVEANGTLATELWWSCGATGGDTDFRTQNYCIEEFSYSSNGTATLGNTNTGNMDDKTALRIFPLVQTNANAPVTTLMVPEFYDNTNTAILMDCLVGWENQIQGQIWDSFIMTKTNTLEDVRVYSETWGTSTWINYSSAPTGWQHNGNGTIIFSLYLLTGTSAGGPTNYVY